MLRSFSLLETLISIILLSIIISNFSNISNQNSKYEIFHKTLNLNNEINTNSFSSFSNKKVDMDFNFDSISNLSYMDGNTYTLYSYDKELKLEYIQIQKKKQNFIFKDFE